MLGEESERINDIPFLFATRHTPAPIWLKNKNINTIVILNFEIIWNHLAYLTTTTIRLNRGIKNTLHFQQGVTMSHFLFLTSSYQSKDDKLTIIYLKMESSNQVTPVPQIKSIYIYMHLRVDKADRTEETTAVIVLRLVRSLGRTPYFKNLQQLQFVMEK